MIAMVSAALTLAVVTVPELHSAYRDPQLHVAVETAASLIAMLALFLMVGRLRRRTRLHELVLACALTVLAMTDLIFVTTPALVVSMPRDLALWGALAGRWLGAVLFALAAFVPDLRLRRTAAALAATAGGMILAVAATVLLVHKVSGGLSDALAAPRLAETAALPDAHSGPGLLAAQVVVTGLYAIAAVGFLRACERLNDEFFGWLAIGSVLAAASQVSYLLHPSQYPDRVYIGDGFRLCCFTILLLGSMREIWWYWRARTDAAVQDERRRIACDLHDGVAQELAYLARNLKLLGEEVDDDIRGRLQSAVARAEQQSRRTIGTLSVAPGQALGDMLLRATVEIAQRFNVELVVDLDRDLRLPGQRAEALVRIACEAVTNAARHSGADRVSVVLTRDGSLARLRVSDAGRGFNTAAVPGGFGLTSMRERARAVGGELWISSAPGHGSQVEAAV